MNLIKKFVPLLVLGLVLTGCAAQEEEVVVEEPTELTGTINVYTRDASSGTREAFQGFIGVKEDLTASAIEVTGNGDMAAKVGADVYGIGYVSLTTDFAANNVKPLQYNGVDASIENVLNGSYTLSRPFSYVTRAAGDFASAEQEAVVLAFMDYLVNSVEGREIVYGTGGIVDVDAGTPWEELKANHPITANDLSAYTLSTGGSTSVEKSLEAALEGFKALTGAGFVMNQTGSSDGFKRVLGGEKDTANAADIGFASRKFKDEETVANGAVSGAYCLDGVAVIVEVNNPYANTNKDTLFSIFTGAITAWEDAE